jgi:thymidylate kinase
MKLLTKNRSYKTVRSPEELLRFFEKRGGKILCFEGVRKSGKTTLLRKFLSLRDLHYVLPIVYTTMGEGVRTPHDLKHRVNHIDFLNGSVFVLDFLRQAALTETSLNNPILIFMNRCYLSVLVYNLEEVQRFFLQKFVEWAIELKLWIVLVTTPYSTLVERTKKGEKHRSWGWEFSDDPAESVRIELERYAAAVGTFEELGFHNFVIYKGENIEHSRAKR